MARPSCYNCLKGKTITVNTHLINYLLEDEDIRVCNEGGPTDITDENEDYAVVCDDYDPYEPDDNEEDEESGTTNH